jgi:hypothetical protein
VTVHIYGAGMAGLIAAIMLRRLRPVLHEAQPSFPDNHGALLRFRTDAVARETGQTFRKVRVLKAVKSGGALRSVSTLRDANLYAMKVTGSVAPRSILDLVPVDRWIAPPDFLNVMYQSLDEDIEFSDPLDFAEIQNAKPSDAIISTIPMPALMSIVEWPSAPEFRHVSVRSISATIQEPATDVYQTIYYPEPDVPQYRASITGNRLIIEVAGDVESNIHGGFIHDVLSDFGLDDCLCGAFTEKVQTFGKILPIPDEERHQFILSMTDRFRIYSVGRFATWRQILLDDVVDDVRWIESAIAERSAYARRLAAR